MRSPVMEYVETEVPPATVVDPEARYGPHGRCIRALRDDGYGLNSEHRCKAPAATDSGWCGDCLAELQSSP